MDLGSQVSVTINMKFTTPLSYFVTLGRLLSLSYLIEGASTFHDPLNFEGFPPSQRPLGFPNSQGDEHGVYLGAAFEPLQATSQVLDDDFDRWIQELADEWSIKGIGIAVVRRLPGSNGWAVETKGYGIRNSAGEPVTNDVSDILLQPSTLFTI